MEFIMLEKHVNKITGIDKNTPATQKMIELQLKNHLEGAILRNKKDDKYHFDIPNSLLEESVYNNKKFFIAKNKSFVIIEKDGIWMGILQ